MYWTIQLYQLEFSCCHSSEKYNTEVYTERKELIKARLYCMELVMFPASLYLNS